MQTVAMCVSVAVSFLLDTIVFPRLNIVGIRPSTLLVLVVLFSIQAGTFKGVVTGVVGGLMVDICFGVYIGLSSLEYLIIGLLAGVFHKRFFADNVLLPAVIVFSGYVFKEVMTTLFLMLLGSNVSVGIMLVRYILPSALMSAIITMPLFLLYKRMFLRQVKRRGRHD